MSRRSPLLAGPDIAADQLGFLRWGLVGSRIVVTNDAGEWLFLDDAEFADLLAGRVVAGHPRFEELRRKGFLRDGLDADALAARLSVRTRHVRRGPYRHVVTLIRSAGQQGHVAMSRETCEKVASLALQGSSPSLTFDLCGSDADPLSSFDVLRHLVESVQLANKQVAGKRLTFRLFTGFTVMSEEIAEWLIDHDVRVMARFDGPADLHDGNRPWSRSAPHDEVVRWIEHLQRRCAELSRTPACVEAAATPTRQILESAREVVDEYVRRGLPGICLRPLERFRFAPQAWREVGYTLEEYLPLYSAALDHIVGLNTRGAAIREEMAAVFAAKILGAEGIETVEPRSPSGAGTSELYYDADGRVFPCEEGRVLADNGDPMFELGNARDLTVTQILRHAAVRAVGAASLLDSQPMCADCWNKPYCGFNPVRNYITQSDLFGQRWRCTECKLHMAVSERIIRLLSEEAQRGAGDVLRRWASSLHA